ncbi:MAG TPA: hypothetical protein PL182_02160 [Pseudobdellovibrionaceae bacterium]|nr:hypothetical protein [Pseudobdellovibrionaceae bacterium]
MGAYAQETEGLNQCAVDLCGPASNKLTLSARGVFQEVVPLSVKAFLKSELSPSLDQSFKSFQNLQAKKVRAAKRIGNDPSRFRFNQYQRSFLTIASILSMIMKDAEQVLESADGSTYTVNRESLSGLYPMMERSRIDLMAKMFDEFSGSIDSRYADFAGDSDYDYFFRVYLGVQGDLDPKQIQQVMPVFVTQFGDVISKIGIFAFSEMDTSLLFRDLSQEPLSEIEKKEVMDIISRTFGYQGVFREKIVSLAATIDLSVEEAMAHLNFKSKVLSQEKSLRDVETQEKNRKEFFARCSNSAIRFFAAAPSPLRSRANEELLTKVQTASLKTAGRYFSGESLSAAQKAILSLKVKKPMTSFDAEKRLKDVILAQERREQASESHFDYMTGSTESAENVFLYFTREFIGRDGLNGLNENLSKFCKRLAPPSFEDKAYGRDGLIQIGWQSSLFPEIGAGIMAHEIGHIVSGRVESKAEGNGEYKQVRQCSAKRHGFLTGKSASQYAEEDWADHFAADVIRELSLMGTHGENFGCALLRLEEDRAEYGDLKLFDPRGADTHSESILRALLIEKKLKGRIPVSCQKAVGEKAGILEDGFCGG